MIKRALVTGITGQDGSYLREHLAANNIEVHAVVRTPPEPGDQEVAGDVVVHRGNLAQADLSYFESLVEEVSPDVVFNLAAVSSVARSWAEPELTARVNGLAAVSLLEAVWRYQDRSGSVVRFVQASSSEIFGNSDGFEQSESTRLRPVNPYGAAKAFAHVSVAMYRERGMLASNAVLYNHESPRRPPWFVSRKIAEGVARIASGDAHEIELGNLAAQRDWSWAPDVVDALTLIAAGTADDYIVASGKLHSVADFTEQAFARAGIHDWQSRVRIDKTHVRPVDVIASSGDSSKIRTELGWMPTVDFEGIVSRMVDAELERLHH